MNRRNVLRVVGSSTVILLAGCSSDNDGSQEEPTSEQNHHTATYSTDDEFPSYSGTVTISGDDDYWSFALDMESEFSLSYTVTNTKSENFDFDVFVYNQQQYDIYVETVQGNDNSPDEIDSASLEGVRNSESRTVELEAGTYYFVVDNTDIGDAGDFGSEEIREVQIELQTGEPGELTQNEAPTENEDDEHEGDEDTRHEPDETFTVGDDDTTLQYAVRPDGLFEAIGTIEANGIFFVVELDIKNVSDKPILLSSGMFTLVNEKGQEFDVSSSGLIQMESPLLFEELNPGIEITGHLPFEIPNQGEHAYALRIEPVEVFTFAETHIVDLATVDL